VPLDKKLTKLQRPHPWGTVRSFEKWGVPSLDEVPSSFQYCYRRTDGSWRNFFNAIKFLGVIRFAAAYPFIGIFLYVLQLLIPSIAAKRRAHLQFTEEKIDERLNRKTDRKDFLQYVGDLLPTSWKLCSNESLHIDTSQRRRRGAAPEP
jgi:hypothetical protein